VKEKHLPHPRKQVSLSVIPKSSLGAGACLLGTTLLYVSESNIDVNERKRLAYQIKKTFPSHPTACFSFPLVREGKEFNFLVDSYEG
jgi:hypothetical protein